MSEEKKEQGSLLGRGSEFNGKLTFMGTVRIEGKLSGEVYSDDTLVVAAGGEVSGTLKVGTLIVTGGKVEATVIARDAVEIHPEGCVVGEVESPVFEIERGAIFQGTCTMPDSAKRAQPSEESS